MILGKNGSYDVYLNPAARVALNIDQDSRACSNSLSYQILQSRGFPEKAVLIRISNGEQCHLRYESHPGPFAIRLRCMEIADPKLSIRAFEMEFSLDKEDFQNFLNDEDNADHTHSGNTARIIEHSLEYCVRRFDASFALASFTEYQANPLVAPHNVDNQLKETVLQVISTSGRTEEDHTCHAVHPAGDLNTIVFARTRPESERDWYLGLYFQKPFTRSCILGPILVEVLDFLANNLPAESPAISESSLQHLLRFDSGTTAPGIALCDGAGKVLDVSSALLNLLGLETSDIFGRRFDQLPLMTRIPSTNFAGRFPVTYHYERPDGSVLHFNTTSLPLDGKDNRGSLLLILNVSPIRMLEEELSLARSQAAAAEQSKSNFISNISHELRTPLNGINGMAQLLEDTVTGEEEADIVDTLRQSVLNLNNLIQDLLDFSRIDMGKISIDEDFFSLETILEQVLNNHRRDMQKKSLELTMAYEREDLWYYCDAMRLQQIINNFLSNAIKFTDQGGIRLAYYLRDKNLVIEVKDTGVGIPEQMQRKIFNSFTQLEHTYTKYRQGLGLGLAICKRLADLMNGSIELESEAGEGAAFRLVLPADETRLKIGNKQEVSQKPGLYGMSQRFKGVRVLIAEDDFLNRKTLIEFMKKQGALVSPAANGLEAEHLLKIMNFDLLILDITMPELGGQDLTRIIRKGSIPRAKNVPILGVTAHVYPADIQSFLQAGMDQILTKPFIAEQLYDKCQSVLTKSS